VRVDAELWPDRDWRPWQGVRRRPLSFGTVVCPETDVVEFLEDRRDALLDVLSKMQDKIEAGA